MYEFLVPFLTGSMFAFLISLIVVNLVFYFKGIKVAAINLVNANADLAGGSHAWEFRVDGKEIPAGKSLRVVECSFEIEVIEFASHQVVDKLDIGSLFEKGDKIDCVYSGPKADPPQAEALFIRIEHSDGSFRMVPVNINKP